MSKLMIVSLLLLGLSSPSTAAEQTSVPKWLLGIWELTDDPDRSPIDWMEYRADGTFVNTLIDCRKATGTFHLFRGDVYLAIEQNGKFLANGSRPNQEKTKLLYTSPRTRNTATYEKVASVKCHGG